MTLDRTKLAVWIALFAAVGAGYLFWNEQPAPRPEPPAIHVELPPPAPPVVVTVPAPGPPVAAPVPPVVKPAPAPAPKVHKAVKPKPLKKATPKDPCAQVPAKAYQFPKDMVLAEATRRGLSAVNLTKLGLCIDKHAG